MNKSKSLDPIVRHIKTFILALLLVLGLASWAEAATLTKSERVLVIVTDLDTHGIPELAPLYATLEDIGIGLPQLPILKNAYREIHVLRNANATLAKFRSKLRQLGSRPEIKAIDTFLMLHGLANELVFADGRVTTAEMVEFMAHAPTAAERVQRIMTRKKLRIMYNTSCFGSSHRNEFLQMGYKAVSGSVKVNANAGVEYPSFLGLWTAGATFEESFLPSNNPTALAMADGPLVAAGTLANNFLKHVDSRKILDGDLGIRINTDAR